MFCRLEHKMLYDIFSVCEILWPKIQYTFLLVSGGRSLDINGSCLMTARFYEPVFVVFFLKRNTKCQHAGSESHKIVNVLNKKNLTKTVLGIASHSAYKCLLLPQTLLCKLSTQQHGLPLKRQSTKPSITCDHITSLFSLPCDSKTWQFNITRF